MVSHNLIKTNVFNLLTLSKVKFHCHLSSLDWRSVFTDLPQEIDRLARKKNLHRVMRKSQDKMRETGAAYDNLSDGWETH